MHTIRGAVMRAEYADNAGIAHLSFTLRQPGAGRFTSQPIEALMSYGSGEAAHAAAKRAADSIQLGGIYRLYGRGLAATGGQVWLMGVEEWSLVMPAPDLLEPAEPESLVRMRTRLLSVANVVSA